MQVYLLYLDSGGAEDLLAICATLDAAKIRARNAVIEDASISAEDAENLPPLEWDAWEDQTLQEWTCSMEVTDDSEDGEDWEGELRIEAHTVQE